MWCRILKFCTLWGPSERDSKYPIPPWSDMTFPFVFVKSLAAAFCAICRRLKVGSHRGTLVFWHVSEHWLMLDQEQSLYFVGFDQEQWKKIKKIKLPTRSCGRLCQKLHFCVASAALRRSLLTVKCTVSVAMRFYEFYFVEKFQNVLVFAHLRSQQVRRRKKDKKKTSRTLSHYCSKRLFL